MSARKLSDKWRTWVEVRRSAILKNFAAVRRLVGKKVGVLAVIKANGYGHGLREMVSILKKEQPLMFGVDSLEEAETVMQEECATPVIILGQIPRGRFRDAAAAGFRVSLYNAETIRTFAELQKSRPSLPLYGHLKVETGTNRLGMRLEELQRLRYLPPFEGIYTHFADTEDASSRFYLEQHAALEMVARYLAFRGLAPRMQHMAATAAILQYPETHGTLVRWGIGLYGLWPSKNLQEQLRQRINLTPALSWKTTVAQVKRVAKGETIGYDRTYRAKKDMEIAVLPVGYSDGFPRMLSNKGLVCVRGGAVPLVGRVCMNMIMADVTGLRARAGDIAELLGEDSKISVDMMASLAGTINYEIVARINPLIPRIVV